MLRAERVFNLRDGESGWHFASKPEVENALVSSLCLARYFGPGIEEFAIQAAWIRFNLKEKMNVRKSN